MHSSYSSSLRTILAFAAAAALALPAQAQPRLLRGGVDVVPPAGDAQRFHLDLAAGIATVADFGDAEAFVSVTPRWRLTGDAKRTLELTLPLLWIPGSHDASGLDPLEVPFDLRPQGTEIGSSLVLAPSLEWTFCTAGCWRPSVFVGAGVRQDRDRRTRFGGGERRDLDDVESPVLTLGFAIHKPLNRKLTLRLEARALTTVYDDETFFVDAAGVPVSLDGGAVTSLWLSAGIRFGW